MELVNKVFDIKLLKDSIYFKVVFCIWTLIHLFAFAQPYTGYLSIIMIAWGGLLLIKNLFIDKAEIPKLLKNLLFAFIISYCITIVLNIHNNMVGNIKTLIWSSIMMFALFANEPWKSKEDIKNDLIKISKVLTISTFITSIISIGMFCFNYNYWIDRVDGATIPQGYYAARLWGFFIDPNQAAVVGLISIVLSMIIIIDKTRMVKFAYLNIIIQYIFMILTASRGGEIAFVVVSTAVAYLLLSKYFKEKIKKQWLKITTFILVSCMISLALVLTFNATRDALALVPEGILKLENYVGTEGETDVTVKRPDVGGEDASNGRITLWTDGFKLAKFSPIFGYGDRNISLKAAELTPGSSLEKQFVHNGFIHMLLGGGIVAVIIMLIFMLIIIIKSIKVFFNDKIEDNYKKYCDLLLILMGVLVVTTMFLTEIFYQNSFAATMFWIGLGYITILLPEESHKIN